jgi:DNA processing protein
MNLKESILSYPIKRIDKSSSLYPTPLQDLFDPPKELYVRGTLSKSWNKCVAIVGSRKVSLYGRRATEEFASGLVSKDYKIVSGFMYGVDVVVHSKVVELGGVTIAVLAHGLDHFYPNQNLLLYKKILDCGGCVVSEYEPGFAPRMWTFPKRNRIVAALSLGGVIVVEAQLGSGSLITARYAEALGRDVMAIPGNIDSDNSKGTNHLIKTNAARIVTGPEDVYATSLSNLNSLGLTKTEELVFDSLREGALSYHDLKSKTGLEKPKLEATLTSLSMKALVGEVGGQYFLRKS